MNIALIAHDSKKELMVQFCIAYCGIMRRHNLCATGTTGRLRFGSDRPDRQTLSQRLPGRGPADRLADCLQRDRFAALLPRPADQQVARTERNEPAAAVRRPQYPDGDQYRDGGSFNPWPRTGRPRLADYRQPGGIKRPLYLYDGKVSVCDLPPGGAFRLLCLLIGNFFVNVGHNPANFAAKNRDNRREPNGIRNQIDQRHGRRPPVGQL